MNCFRLWFYRFHCVDCVDSNWIYCIARCDCAMIYCMHSHASRRCVGRYWMTSESDCTTDWMTKRKKKIICSRTAPTPTTWIFFALALVCFHLVFAAINHRSRAFCAFSIAILFCSFQLQKHAPIKSANQLPNNQLKHLSSSNRLSNGTTNGSTAYNRQQHVPIYAKQPVYQQQPRLADDDVKVTTIASSKDRLQQQTTESNGKVTSTPTNNGKRKQPLPPSDASNPPQKHLKQQTNSKHSSSTNSPATIANQNPTPVSSSSLFVPIQSVTTTQATTKPVEVIQNGEHQSSASTAPAPAITAELNASSNSRVSEQNGQTPDASGTPNESSIKKECNDLLSHPTPIRPTNGVGKGKKLPKTPSNTFAKPKTEPKHTIGKKLSLSNGKRKRSYSQTSHHEALQRISASRQSQSSSSNGGDAKVSSKQSSRTKLKREWHAPDSFLFDLGCSFDAIHDEDDAAPCWQEYWFRDIPNANLLTREQRLEMKRDNLRRQATQYTQAQTFRNRRMAKLRLMSATNALNKFKNERIK